MCRVAQAGCTSTSPFTVIEPRYLEMWFLTKSAPSSGPEGRRQKCESTGEMGCGGGEGEGRVLTLPCTQNHTSIHPHHHSPIKGTAHAKPESLPRSPIASHISALSGPPKCWRHLPPEFFQRAYVVMQPLKTELQSTLKGRNSLMMRGFLGPLGCPSPPRIRHSVSSEKSSPADVEQVFRRRHARAHYPGKLLHA